MTNEPEDDDCMEKTAYHESGHAVASTLLGGFVASISIQPESQHQEKRFGEVVVHWGGSGTKKAQILSALAGPVAESIYIGEPYHPGLIPEWKQDWDTAWLLASTRYPDPKQRLRALEQSTRSLHQRLRQDDCWSAIAAVADLLLAHETLDADELREEIAQWIEAW